MKKIVLIISMVLCASLFMGCANILDGLTTQVETNSVGIPTGEYKCIAIKNGDVVDTKTDITSSGALINSNYGKFDKCDYIAYLPMEFLEHGKIKFVGNKEPTEQLKWRYDNSRLYITAVQHNIEYIFKHV